MNFFIFVRLLCMLFVISGTDKASYLDNVSSPILDCRCNDEKNEIQHCFRLYRFIEVFINKTFPCIRGQSCLN